MIRGIVQAATTFSSVLRDRPLTVGIHKSRLQLAVPVARWKVRDSAPM
jgi:hypothetical protein